MLQCAPFHLPVSGIKRCQYGVQSVAEVNPDAFRGNGFIPFFEGCDEVPVFFDDPGDAVGRIHGPDAEEPGAALHLLDEARKNGAVGGGEDDSVELHVRLDDAFHVGTAGTGLHALHVLPELFENSGRQVREGPLDRESLQVEAECVELDDVFFLQPGDDETPVRELFDEPFCHEAVQGVMDGRPADAHALRQRTFHKAGAGGDLSLQDGGAEFFEGSFAETLHCGEL